MKNEIRSNGKIWKRRSKNLTSGEINCPRCGIWKPIKKFTDKHFNDEYFCQRCKKELKELEPKKVSTKVSGKPKKKKPQWAIDCPHRPFFACKKASECQGCYYNPTKKIALLLKEPDDPKKTATNNWFYGNKKDAKKLLKILDDIKSGKGLHIGGRRTYFKYARKGDN